MSDLTGKYITRSDVTRNWSYRFDIGGQTFKGTTGTKNKREAEAIAKEERRKAREEMDRGRKLGLEPMTWGDACDHWLADVAQFLDETGLVTKTTDARGQPVLTAGTQVAFVRAQIGPARLLTAIRDVDITSLISARRSHTRADPKLGARPVTSTTVNKTLNLVRRILNHARDRRSALVAPVNWGKHWLEENHRPKPRDRAVGPRTEARLDAYELTHGFEDFMVVRKFGTVTGRRAEEFIPLTWFQIDRDERTMSIPDTKGGAPQTVPLGDEAWAIVDAEWRRPDRHATAVFTYRAKRTRNYLHGRNGRRMQFVRGQRYPMTYERFTAHRIAHWPRAGVHARLHDLRHTAGCRIVDATGNLKAAQQMLGHADIATTSRYYAEASDDTLRQAQDAAAAAARARTKSAPKFAPANDEGPQTIGKAE